MKKRSWLWSLWGFAVTAFLGTILHYLYDWTGGAVWMAPFSGVNESTWEHMKLLFWPMLLFALVERIFVRDRRDFFRVKLCSILLGLFLIPALFYTYNGAIGPSPDWLNIAIFFTAAAVAYLYEACRFQRREAHVALPCLSLFGLLALAVLFVAFTFSPPAYPLFLDPVTGTYGIPS